MKGLVFVSFLVLVVVGFVQAAVIHVPGDYSTIQAGINAAANGDTVLVADGTYTGSGNRNLNFNGKAITVASENGATSTIIDCEVSTIGFRFVSGETSTSVVRGFTIKWSKHSGIYCDRSSPIIENNILTRNIEFSTSPGGGIHCTNVASPIIRNNLLEHNAGSGYGGGIVCENASSPTIVNNTIIRNLGGLLIQNAGGGIVTLTDSHPSIFNCILWDNSPKQIDRRAGSRVTIGYSDIQGGGWPAGNNINADPLFVNTAISPYDYHLRNDSPCIGAGHKLFGNPPSTDIEGNPRPNPSGSNPDMGAYENVLGTPVPLAPTITSVTPSGRGQGANFQDIVITGTDFVGGATVSFSGTGITVNATTFVSSTKLRTNINVAPTAPTGTDGVTVTNPGGQTATGQNMFSVSPASTVTSTNPSSLLQGSVNQDVAISGSGFVDNLPGDPNGPQLAANFGSGITVNSVAFINGTQLTANISVAGAASVGLRNVTVTNGDGGVRIGVGIFEVLFNDIYPPASVTNFLALPSYTTGNVINLQWTAPGDDGNTGTASKYIIKYNTVPITEVNWEISSDVEGEPTPSPAGSMETMQITTLCPGVMYYFALRTKDEIPNRSDISNNSSVRTPIQLYQGWNLVAFMLSESMGVGEAMSCIVEKWSSVWKYDASTGSWLRHIAQGPSFLNNLIQMEPGYGYWLRVTEDCAWNLTCNIPVSPPALAIQKAMRKPPFLLYGKLTADIAPIKNPEVSLRVGGAKAGSYIIGSNQRYGDYYVLEIPVDGPFHEGDIAQLYVDGILAKENPIALGRIGVVKRHDISYLRIPKTTRLLQNYPNPFNPETWIPYQLAEGSEVRIRIYGTDGELIRKLELGIKPAGLYISKDKAAYWDGRNDAGEQAASGVCFYCLQAGDFTETKKMIILK